MVYKKVSGTAGKVWLLNPAHVILCDPLNHDGCSGDLFKFKLDSGGFFEWKGPWFSNCESYLKDMEEKNVRASKKI